MGWTTGIGKRRVTRRRFLTGAATATAAAGLGLRLLEEPAWLTKARAQGPERAGSGERHAFTVHSPNCWQACPLTATVRDGRLVRVEPAKLPDQDYQRICLRGLSEIQRLYGTDRLRYPLKRVGKRGEGKWQRITWDEAIATMVDRFKAAREKYGPSGLALVTLSGNYGAFNGSTARLANLLQATAPVGSIDLNTATGWTRVGGGPVFGYDASEPLDWVNCRTILLWGSSVAETQVHSTYFLLQALDQGATLVVIDPRFSTIASKADIWVRPKPGTDAALGLSMLDVILRENLWDRDFVLAHTTAPFLVRKDNGKFLRAGEAGLPGDPERRVLWDSGKGGPVAEGTPGAVPALTGSFTVHGTEVRPAFQILADEAARYSGERGTAVHGVPVATVEQVARLYATRRPNGIYFGMGTDRYFNGDRAGQAMATLAAFTGGFGQSGNIQGMYFTYYGNPKFDAPTGTTARYVANIDWYEDIREHPIGAMWVTCGDIYNQLPDRSRVKAIWDSIPFIVVSDLVMTPTAQNADLVLPAAHYYETTEPLAEGAHPYVLFREAAVEPLGEARPDWEVQKEIAKAFGFGAYFDKSMQELVAEWLDSDMMRSAGVTAERLMKEHAVRVWPKLNGRPYHAPARSQHPDGLFHVYNEEGVQAGVAYATYIPAAEATDAELAKRYPLVFNTQHGRWRVHSQLANVPMLRELSVRPVVEINPADAEARGIREGDVVEVFNDRGHVVAHARIAPAMMPGMVNLQQGWWDEHYIEGHHQELTHQKRNIVGNFAFFDIRVEVRKKTGVA